MLKRDSAERNCVHQDLPVICGKYIIIRASKDKAHSYSALGTLGLRTL